MERISLVIKGTPLSKQSTRIGKRKGKTVAYTAAKYTAAKRSNILQVKAQLPKGWQLLEGAVIVERLVFVLPATTAHLASKDRVKALQAGAVFAHTKRPDLPDNLPKLLFDSLSGLVFKDDALIWGIEHSCKVYGLDPRVEITIRGAIEKNKGFELVDIS